ncbi:MAG: peroxiredoxin [Ferruginibacter sp.]|nr:peroxiredoxin [Ferruginibacter sp.]
MERKHQYALWIEWTGNTGEGTKNYQSYERSHTISVENKYVIEGSADVAFRGDAKKHNPEELFLASIATCHMLWYLHLCSDAGIIITAYVDHATGIMVETSSGGGRFTEVMLNPAVTITNESKKNEAEALHKKANELCYVANSCNFPIHHQPVIYVEGN